MGMFKGRKIGLQTLSWSSILRSPGIRNFGDSKRYTNYKVHERDISIDNKNDRIGGNDLFDVEEMNKEKLIYVLKNIQIMDLKDKNILNNISNLIKKNSTHFNADEIYLIIHCFSKLQFPKYSLNTRLVKILMNTKPKLNSRIITQILIDLHKTSSLDTTVLTFFSEHYIKNSLLQFSLFDLSMVLYIYNKYNYNDALAVDNICKVIEDHFLPFINEDKGVLTTILLSTSILNLGFPLYYLLLKNVVYKNYKTFEIKYLCNIAYSIVLRLSNSLNESKEFLNMVLYEIVQLLIPNLNKLKNEELKQMHIILYFLKTEDNKFDGAIKLIEKKKIKNTITVSKIQHQIEKLLKEIGLVLQKEFPLGPYILDFALTKKKICIEVNGFTHYYVFSGNINAKTNLKYYILKKLQWEILSIEYTNWKNKSKEDRIRYLEKNIIDKIK